MGNCAGCSHNEGGCIVCCIDCICAICVRHGSNEECSLGAIFDRYDYAAAEADGDQS